MSSTFKTPEFKALFREWNARLKESGHQEVEDFSLPDPPLKCWHNLKWIGIDKKKLKETQSYYMMAVQLLYDFEFINETHKAIWELHSNGLSVVEIANKINRKNFRSNRVFHVIQTIQRKTGIRNG